MKRWFSILASALIVLNSGCTKIQYDDEISVPDTTDEEPIGTLPEEQTGEKPLFEEPGVQFPDTVLESFSLMVEAEEGRNAYSSLSGYSGKGYIQLIPGEYEDFEIEVTASQWYRITLGICAGNATVSIGEAKEGGAVYGALYIREAVNFRNFSMDGIYLTKGKHTIRIQSVSGYAYLDYISIDDSPALGDYEYSSPRGLVNKEASTSAIKLMSYLSENYGKKVLTGQACTINSNLEIAAVYEVTGRYPAIRAGDLARYSRYYDGVGKGQNKEIELALEYAKRGGIVYFGWTWYAPGEESHYLAHGTDFKLDKAVSDYDIANLTPENLDILYRDGTISKECLELMLDIDAVAEALKVLKDADVPVLFAPLSQAASGLYWWGDAKPASIIWLWQVMVERMNTYHGLNNLIWVWSGGLGEIYPGDSYVDLIGEAIHSTGPYSESVRFSNATRYSIQNKGIAMTETAFIPDPDILYRDNALWLWTTLWSGETIVNSDGTLSGQNSKEALMKAYWHSLTITLEELDFS